MVTKCGPLNFLDKRDCDTCRLLKKNLIASFADYFPRAWAPIVPFRRFVNCVYVVCIFPRHGRTPTGRHPLYNFVYIAVRTVYHIDISLSSPLCRPRQGAGAHHWNSRRPNPNFLITEGGGGIAMAYICWRKIVQGFLQFFSVFFYKARRLAQTWGGELRMLLVFIC